MKISSELILPCGTRIKNRFAKSAMSEILGTKNHAPSDQLATLYERWAKGGSGLLITGNVMIDSRALGEPNNVVIEDETNLALLKDWSRAGKQNNTEIWVQLNHPGKQSPLFLSKTPVAPSAIPLRGDLKTFFNTPRELTPVEITEVIHRFANAALIVKKAGFTGVQIHGAHGYLVSQFLSPHHNRRNDQWGGSIENRMRFVMEVYLAIREKVGPEFPVGIKLNSSDFQSSGFSEDESKFVISNLDQEGIDLIEISGGTYEKPAMMGGRQSKSTQKREAYFAEFCRSLRNQCAKPLMLTGGFRSAVSMEEALQNDVCDMIGLARPLTLDPDLPLKILSGDLSYISQATMLTTGWQTLDRLSMLNITWYEQQIALLGNHKDPQPLMHPLKSILKTFASMGASGFRKRRA